MSSGRFWPNFTTKFIPYKTFINQKTLIMKTLRYLLVLAVIFIAGCEKNDIMLDNPYYEHGRDKMEVKRANVPIPFKADCWVIPDWDSAPMLVENLDPNDPKSYGLSRLFIGGTGSHLGKINPKESYYLFEKMVFVIEADGTMYTSLAGVGKMVGANGDGMTFTFSSKQYLNGDFFGEAEIIPGSGTGKFKGSTGSLETSGGYTMDGEIWLKANGFLVYE
jgi:hypothetical protein